LVVERDLEAQLLITDIKRFLKNSFAAVEYENISVILSKRSPTQHVAPSVAASQQPLHGVWLLSVIAGLLLAGGAAWAYRQSGAGRRDVAR
jgi:type III secretion protein J